MSTIREVEGYWPQGDNTPFNPNHAKIGDPIRPIFDKDGKIMHGLPKDNALANKLLKDQVYHIALLTIEPFVSWVSLKEIRGYRFNSVHFKFDKGEVPAPERDREFPCGQCEDGEYIHDHSGPGYMKYICDRCGHEVTFP